MARVLVVDDLAPNRLIISRLCQQFGHQTIAAEDGVEAISLATTQSPDLILLDISMPNMDGYEAARRIKSVSSDSYLPIIFVTAHSSDSSLSQAIAAGGDDFISVPVSAEILESKITAHLRIRELNEQLLAQNRQLELHNRRLRQEADLITQFFDKALARSYKDPSRITCHSSPASAFNGDLILVERGPVGQVYLLLGDFTGHGLQAAMGTLPVQQTFFELCQQGAGLSTLTRTINNQLYQSLPDSIFFAATLLCFEASFRQMEGWFGGMPAALLVDNQGQIALELASNHMPLGILNPAEFDDATTNHRLPEASRLYLFSDGAEERKNQRGEAMGEQGLRDLLQHKDAPERFVTLQAELVVAGDGTQQDDISFVEVVI